MQPIIAAEIARDRHERALREARTAALARRGRPRRKRPIDALLSLLTR